jgi:hypothetical protein
MDLSRVIPIRTPVMQPLLHLLLAVYSSTHELVLTVRLPAQLACPAMCRPPSPTTRRLVGYPVCWRRRLPSCLALLLELGRHYIRLHLDRCCLVAAVDLRPI